MGFVFRWFVTAGAIALTPYIVSGVSVRDFGSALIAAALLAVLNAVIRPLLILLTLPLTLLTFGFFILILNALLFQFAGQLAGIAFDSFFSALCASLWVSLVSWAINGWSRNRISFQVHRGPRQSRRDGRTVDMHKSGDGKWE